KYSGAKETNAFMGFVDRVLSFRQDLHSPNIKKFCLDSDYTFDKSRVREWIFTVMRHKVEELVLSDRSGSNSMYPPCLFTSESLTMLEISKSYLELPASVYFPKLKILRLGVEFWDQLIPKLLSASPVLEELNLQVCARDMQYLSIFGPNLKRLFINGLINQNFNIQIDAPNLKSLKYSSILTKEFVQHNFSTLHDAEVILSRSANRLSERGELGYLATKLFHNLSYVKRLAISDYSLKLLTYQDRFLKSLPSFYNLIHLEIRSAGLEYAYGFGDECSLQCWVVGKLLSFLHVLPNLESLTVADGFCYYELCPYYYWSLDLIPQCMLFHLKTIEFRRFFWNLFEKDLVRLFLKNAKVLQTVRITISDRSLYLPKTDYKKIVLDEIASYPRGSADCVFHVS
ncbi:hypothetical protein MKW92_038914, partial [Papaver armeniacum]